MEKRKITKEEIKAYRKTPSGRSRYLLMHIGIVISVSATLGITVLIINANRIFNPIYFYICLYLLIIIAVLGGELVGVYYGAIEQSFSEEHKKKVLNIDE